MRWLRFYRTQKRSACSLLFCVFLVQQAAAQKRAERQPEHLIATYADTTPRPYSAGRPYYFARWNGPAPKNLKIIRQLDAQSAIVEVGTQSVLDSLRNRLNLAPATNNWKWAPALEQQLAKQKAQPQKFILSGQHIDTLLAALQERRRDATILFVHRPSHSVVVHCTARYLQDHLLGLKEVIFIDAPLQAHAEAGIIGYNRSFHGVNAVDYRIPHANGKNIVAGVKEQDMDRNDIDLWKRVLPSSLAAANPSNHATVIASIIGGAGNSFYDGRGIAWGCTFFPSSFANLFADDSAVLRSNRVSVQNHSYGTVVQQFYGAEAVSYDVLTWNNKNYVPVFSSGNQGEAAATEGPYANLAGFANLTGNFKMAKNSITVGAVEADETVPPQSSAGPLYDGRLAPQIAAHGPNGTSDAAAFVSGTIAVLQQVYADSNNQALPSAALTKALLYNTADDIYHTGIDYKTGYGLLNSFAAVQAVQQKAFWKGTVAQSGEWTKDIAVPAQAAQLKITLAWTDSAALVNNSKALINDLDLEVMNLSNGTVYQPWVLSAAAHADSLAKPPVRKRDSLNTAEQVSISLPAAGRYRINVKGRAVHTPELPFAVAYRIDTLNTFAFTNPQHASDVNRSENEFLTIRWRTFVADTNQTGNLFISYDSGATWELLQPSLKLAGNRHLWPIKDTASTAGLKMETSFGSFLSSPFIISRPLQLAVDFNCTDSFRLSWQKHVYAGAYRVFALTDSPYLKPILTVTDTAVVLQRALYPYQVFAVEPLLNNGLAAQRSAAQDIELQGVHCFYRTLNYTLLDSNQLNLVLELSAAAYADSVFFEQVTATGSLLQTYGAAKAGAGTLAYSQQVQQVAAGITYIRGRIKLKSGAQVYTGIIPVLTSGRKYIWFYPNPAGKNTPLQYIVQQGVPAGSRLQLFDANGRLLKDYPSLPDKIDASGFAAGLIFFRLSDRENKTLETGKLVVQ